MIGQLEEAIRDLAVSALGDLFAGDPAPVALSISSDAYTADPTTAEGLAGEPRAADRIDSFLFDPTGIVFDPAAPHYDPAALPSFTLTQPPYDGPRRVRLTSSQGDLIALHPDEVTWDPTDRSIFRLTLRPGRPLVGINGVQVLYAVIAVFTILRATQQVGLLLDTDDGARLARAEALLAGLMALNGQQLADQGTATYESGEYGAVVRIKGLRFTGISSPVPRQRLLAYKVEVETRVTRALRSDEGAPIRHITTPGRPLDPQRPVDIQIEVEA
jgi:hypothetical protein